MFIFEEEEDTAIAPNHKNGMPNEWRAVHKYQEARWRAIAKHPLDIHNEHIALLADDLHMRLLIGSDFCRGSNVKYDLSNFSGCAAAAQIHQISLKNPIPRNNLGERFNQREALLFSNGRQFDLGSPGDSNGYTIDEHAALRADREQLSVPNGETPENDWKIDSVRRIEAAARSCWLTAVGAEELNHKTVISLRMCSIPLFSHILCGPLDKHPHVRAIREERAIARRAELIDELNAIIAHSGVAEVAALIVMEYLHENKKPKPIT